MYRPEGISQSNFQYSHNLNGVSLDDLYKEDSVTSVQFILSYCQELREILTLQDLNEICEQIFQLEKKITALKKIHPDLSEDNIPSLEEFYTVLSPVLLRILQFEELDNVDSSDKFREALRVALEEEIYNWLNHI